MKKRALVLLAEGFPGARIDFPKFGGLFFAKFHMPACLPMDGRIGGIGRIRRTTNGTTLTRSRRESLQE